MTLLEIPTDAILLARIAGLMIFLIFTRKKIAQSLKRRYENLNIMDEMISLESIFILIAYLVLLGLFAYLWPPGWDAWKGSSIFWPAQGLIILAVIGLFSLRKWYMSWFFFAFFILTAVTLTVVSIIRDPDIFPSQIAEDEQQQIPFAPMPEPEPIDTSSVVVVEIREEPANSSVPYQGKVEESLPVYKNSKDTFYIDAPWGRNGERVYLETGYRYSFSPEDTVEGFPDRGESFIDYPKNDVPLKYFESIYWNSHCGHDTKIKVTRKRKSF